MVALEWMINIKSIIKEAILQEKNEKKRTCILVLCGIGGQSSMFSHLRWVQLSKKKTFKDHWLIANKYGKSRGGGKGGGGLNIVKNGVTWYLNGP